MMISVIIPVYNLERYIGKCLDSVCAQSYPDLEIIVVDDGSRDGSVGICRNYARCDQRIRIVQKENGGVSSARNRGIEEAKGEFITFIDGDDVCSVRMLEALMAPMKDDKVILSRCGHKEINRYDEPLASEYGVRQELRAEMYCEQILRGEAEIGVCGGLFRRACIGALRFDPKIRYNEDKLFLFDYVLENRGCVVCFAAGLYGYVQIPTSVTHSGYKPAVLDVILANRMILEHTVQRLPALVPLAEINLHIARLIVLKTMIDSGSYAGEKRTFRQIKQDVLTHRPKTMPFKRRLEQTALGIGDWMYIACVRLYRRWSE